MVYGTLNGPAPEIAAYVRIELDSGSMFVTRNGTPTDPGRADPSAWGRKPVAGQPGTGTVVPVDDLVIDTCRDWALEHDRELADVLLTLATPKGRPNPREFIRDYGQPIRTTSDNRIRLYEQLRDNADVFIFVGGNDGVLRLTMNLLGSPHPFILLGGYGGTASEVASVTAAATPPKTMWRNFTSDQAHEMAEGRPDPAELAEWVEAALTHNLWMSFRAFRQGSLSTKELGVVVSRAIDASISKVTQLLVFALAAVIVIVYLVRIIGDLVGLIAQSLGGA